MVNLSGIKYSVTNLENKYTIQLLKKTLKDAKSLESFVERNEFLEILNGHPLSILLATFIEEDVSMEEQYHKLKEIKQSLNELRPYEIINVLNFEATVKYLNAYNYNALTCLLCFVLCPNGLTSEDLCYIDKDWKNCIEMLISRKIIEEDMNSSRVGDIRQVKSIFRMKESFRNTILLSMGSTEIEEADKKVVELFLRKLKRLYSKWQSNEKQESKLNIMPNTNAFQGLTELEANIREAISRMEDKKENR